MTTKPKLPKDHALVPTNAVDLERVRERCRKLVRNKALRSAGKKRAEALTQTANAAAEPESMQRQLSEAKMQMMQP